MGACHRPSVAAQATPQPGRGGAGRGPDMSPVPAAGPSAGVRQPRVKPLLQQGPCQAAVAPREAAALSQGGLRLARLCWHGFREAGAEASGAEASYQAFRASWLWRWELVARCYHLAVVLGFLAKMADLAHSHVLQLRGWNGVPGEQGGGVGRACRTGGWLGGKQVQFTAWCG
jgi:hypothetical protein